MGTAQSRENSQGTKIAPRNKGKRSEDTKTEGPRPRRPRRPSCKDGTRALVRSMNFRTGVNTSRKGRATLTAGRGPWRMNCDPKTKG